MELRSKTLPEREIALPTRVKNRTRFSEPAVLKKKHLSRAFQNLFGGWFILYEFMGILSVRDS